MDSGSPLTILVSNPEICLAPAGMFRFTTHHNNYNKHNTQQSQQLQPHNYMVCS
jgi:hypothetical protein